MRWSGLRALRVHASAVEQLITTLPPALFSVPAGSLVDLHEDGRLIFRNRFTPPRGRCFLLRCYANQL
ncbi:hypothetical protein NDU88_005955 [Pleurodeles waltl]|uniref:Uncharacterized protein n=1 Tax=Pleurodeles waltl TaxID=8319 RepID=A0AAV7SN36_PLEWA|nr:hypothetical protein NDU88_005955 [Pleurodeles waltl]